MSRDAGVERALGNLLGGGVAAAAGVMAAGALLFLLAHGADPADYANFRAQPPELRNLADLLRAAAALDGRAIMQLGIAILVATPIARVAFSVGAFAHARNARFTAITATVLAVLVYSIFGKH